MNVKLVFEDKFTLEQELHWEFKNTSKQIGLNGLQKIILDSFNEASDFYKLESIAPFSSSEIEIRVLLRSPEKNSTLAYFDMSGIVPESKKFSFKLYADVLFPLIKNENLVPLNSIWIHEIMHLVDYPELLKNLKLYKKIEPVMNRSFYVIDEGKRKDKHIIFLQLILQFRQEGVATLLEFISGGNVNLESTKEAVGLFNKICETSFALSDSPDLNSREISAFFEETVNPLSYQIGSAVVLYGLIKKYPEHKKFKEIDNCLANKTHYTLTESDILVKDIRDFSSFDFIQYCLDHESVYRNIFNLTSAYADNLEIYRSFFSSLQRFGYLKDRKGFIWMMKNIMGSPLTTEEIDSAHIEQKKSMAMPVELLNKAESLYNHFKENGKDEVALWALTYLYDQTDLLDDNIDYFGYLDDLEVVNTAIRLIPAIKLDN